MPPARAVAAPADPRVTFAYVGNPTDAAGRRQALVDHEVLTIGPDHIFAKALPDALDHETWKPYIGIPIYALPCGVTAPLATSRLSMRPDV